MRWKDIELGKKRLKTTFLLIPHKLNRETRWLETAKIKQGYYGTWQDLGWAREEEK